MPIALHENIVEGTDQILNEHLKHPLTHTPLFFGYRNFWEFRRHFPDLADNLYASLDASTQKALERERDGSASNGTSSMSASLRGSNSSLNSMPSSVISMCILCLSNFPYFSCPLLEQSTHTCRRPYRAAGGSPLLSIVSTNRFLFLFSFPFNCISFL